MKSKLLFFLIIAVVFSTTGQITINVSNMPVAGNSYINSVDTTIISYGPAGANQTWDFSAWSNHKSDTTAFVNPASLNGFSHFPSATLGIGDNESSAFMKVSASQVEILGSYADFGSGPIILEFVPAQKFLTLPATYQTAFNGTSAYDITIPGQQGIDSMRMKSGTYTESTIDSWGTITTPAYSNLNALRQNITEIRTDSIWGLLTGQTVWTLFDGGVDTSHTYRWWSDVHNFPVAEVELSEGENIFTGSYLSATLVGINETTKQTNKISVFPNPASNQINLIGISGMSYLTIFDENSKLIEQHKINKNTTNINISRYANGIYFYTIIPLNGTSVSQGKFVVTK